METLNTLKENKTINTFAKENFCVLCYVGIVLLVILRDVVGISVPKVAIIALATMICLISNIDGLFCLASFIAPLHTGVPGNYIIGLIFLTYLFKKRRFVLSGPCIICIGLVIVLELFSVFRGYFDFVDFAIFLCYFLFFTMSLMDKEQILPGKKMLIYFSIGMITAVITLFGQLLRNSSLEAILNLGTRLGGNMTGNDAAMAVSFNSNDLSFLSAMLAATGLFLLKSKRKVVWIGLIIVGILLTVMTQSRSGILMLLLIFVGYFIFTSRNAWKRLWSVVLCVLVLAALIWIVSVILPTYWNSFVMRMEDADISGGRLSIASFYFSEMIDHWDRFFFGVGIQNYVVKYGYFQSSHMMLQEIIIAWGIVGLFCFIYIFYAMTEKALRQCATKREMYSVPLYALLVVFQTGQGFSTRQHYLYIMVALAFLYLGSGRDSFNGQRLVKQPFGMLTKGKEKPIQ